MQDPRRSNLQPAVAYPDGMARPHPHAPTPGPAHPHAPAHGPAHPHAPTHGPAHPHGPSHPHALPGPHGSATGAHTVASAAAPHLAAPRGPMRAGGTGALPAVPVSAHVMNAPAPRTGPLATPAVVPAPVIHMAPALPAPAPFPAAPPAAPPPGGKGYLETATKLAAGAEVKARESSQDPVSFLIWAALAGCYNAFGMVLIFVIGTPLFAAHSPFQKTVMGVSYGLALVLIFFCGGEIFLGQNLFMTLGVGTGKVSVRDLARVWGLSWIGNLAGCLIFGWAIARSGVLAGSDLLNSAVGMKMHLGFMQAFLRAVMCNWLICLALWASARTQNDAVKLVLLSWCLFGFVASGYEQSVGNMSLMAFALFQPHPATISWAGYFHNLIPVSLGNIVGGGFMVGALYWFSTRRYREVPPTGVNGFASVTETLGLVSLVGCPLFLLWVICDAMIR